MNDDLQDRKEAGGPPAKPADAPHGSPATTGSSACNEWGDAGGN